MGRTTGMDGEHGNVEDVDRLVEEDIRIGHNAELLTGGLAIVLFAGGGGQGTKSTD
jgi:hypothetical protein